MTSTPNIGDSLNIVGPAFVAQKYRVSANNNAENTYNLEAKVGSAPQKICVPIGTDYPDEYVKISDAYTPFTEWVSILSPSDWTYTVNPILVDGVLTNNE